MKFYSIIIFFFTSLTVAQGHFVTIDYDKVVVKKKNRTNYIEIPFSIADGIHIQDIIETKENVLPTALNIKFPVESVDYSFQELQYKYVQLDAIQHKVITNVFKIRIEVHSIEGAILPEFIEGNLFYQACNDRQCFFPRTLDFKIEL